MELDLTYAMLISMFASCFYAVLLGKDVKTMWDQTIEYTVDQRGRPVPPVLVRNGTPRTAARPIARSDWRLAATGADRAVLTEALSIIRAAQQVVVFSSFLLSDAAAFISGSCIRVDGAVPNAKAVWGELESRGATPEFNGFHLARRPKVLGPSE